jgi:hypothetical protein
VINTSQLAFPDVGPHGGPSQLFRRRNAVMTVREKQDAVNIEYHDGSGIIQVLEVTRHSVGARCGRLSSIESWERSEIRSSSIGMKPVSRKD